MFSADFGTSRMLRTTGTNDSDLLMGLSIDNAVSTVPIKVENDEEKLVLFVQKVRVFFNF
jgi:hypothetical protein